MGNLMQHGSRLIKVFQKGRPERPLVSCAWLHPSMSLRFTSLTMPPQVRWPLAWALQSRWLMTIRRCALLGVMRRDLVLQHTFPCKCRVSYMLLASDIRYAYAVSEQGVLNVIDWQNVSNPQAHLNLGCQGGSQVCQLHEAVCWLCACCCHADLQRCCLIWPTTLLAPS